MKAILALAVIALVGAASARRVAPRNVITDVITNIINANRGKLANLTIAKLDLGEFGTVENLVIKNLENFILEKLTSPGPLSVDIDNATISLDTASATGLLNLNNVEVPELGLLLNGNGELSGNANILFLTLSIDISLEGLKITVNDFSNLYINVETITAALTGLDNVDEANAIINEKLAGFLNDNLVRIANENKEAILAKVNEILAGIGSY